MLRPRLRALALGRSRERALAWLALAAVLAVLALVDGRYEGLQAAEVHGYWVLRLLWVALGVGLAAGQAYRDRSLLLSWLLALDPVFGDVLALGPGKTRYPPPPLHEQVVSALLVASLVAAVVGTLSFLAGRGVAWLAPERAPGAGRERTG